MALLSHYKLDGNANDSSGNNYHASITGTVKYLDGVGSGKALDFVRANDTRLGIPVAGTNSVTGSLTINCWARVPFQGVSNAAFDKLNTSLSGMNINIHFPWYNSTQTLYFDISNNVTVNRFFKDIDGKSIIGNGSFHMWTFILDGSAEEQKVYIDGQLWETQTGKTYPFVNSNQKLYIGGDSPSGMGWNGVIQELSFYDTALTDAEIRSLYHELADGLLVNVKSNGHNIFCDYSDAPKVIYAGKTQQTGLVDNGLGKVSKYSMYFRGDTTNYLKVDVGYKLNPPFSVCFWVKKKAHAVATYPIFISWGLPYIACNSSTDPFRISLRGKVSNAQEDSVGTTIPALGTWYHITAVFGSSSTKLYVNGIKEGTDGNSAAPTDDTKFDIGRHLDTDTYRALCEIDDVRIYDRELDTDEMGMIINEFQTAQGGTDTLIFKPNGDVTCKQYDEEGIEWTLLDNFISVNDAGRTLYSSAIGGTAIDSIADAQAAGWTTYLTNVDDGSYTLVKGYSQMYYSGGTTGYIYKSLPTGYDTVRVKWGNWYSGTAALKIGGSTVQTAYPNWGPLEYVGDYTGTPEIRIEESGIFWISEVWVGKKKTSTLAITDNDEQQFPEIINTSRSPNLHDYNTWTVGSGSVGEFSQNGDTAENVRFAGSDPFGYPTIIWSCVPDATSNNDGGFNYNAISIDNKYTYRFSIWVRRNSIAAGTTYFGCNGYGSIDGVYNKSDGANNTNPYFLYSISAFPINEWHLLVGHIWHAGASSASGYGNHRNSGVYNRYSKISDITTDFIWRSETTTGRGRAYLFYCTDTTVRQYFCYPLFEKCDGTEAPIGDLLSGAAYNGSNRVPTENEVDTRTYKQSITSDGKLKIKGKLTLK